MQTTFKLFSPNKSTEAQQPDQTEKHKAPPNRQEKNDYSAFIATIEVLLLK